MASGGPTVAIKNLSSAVPDAELASILPAVQKQISTDFFGAWGLDARLVFVENGSTPPVGAWMIGVFDDSDQAGALGYHDMTRDGRPLGKVFAASSFREGGRWTVALSHEVLEMLADPNINLCAFDENNRRLYAYEICDPVESDALGYEIDGVAVSDFVLPAWFEPTHLTGANLAFRSRVTAPLQLQAGGYIGYFDLDGSGWQQLHAREITDARVLSGGTAAPSPFGARPRVGSRRERRRLSKSQWLRSTIS
jgi:hypothetical protein